MKKHLLLSLCFLLSGIIWAQEINNFNAIKFASAADFVSTNWNPSFGSDQDFSIEFSIKSDSWSSDPSIISDKNWASGGNPGFNIALGGNGTGIDVNIGDGSNRADLLSGTINDGEWHHVLVVFDRDANLSMYIDGVLTEETDMSGVGNIDSPFNFNLGQDGTGAYSAAATCELTKIRVWNRVVAYSEVESLRYKDVDDASALKVDLLHNYEMNEGTGTSIADDVAADAFDGTFNGDVEWVTNRVVIPVDFNAIRFSASTDFIGTNWDPTFGADQDFSVEFILRTDGWSSDPSIISDKDWASGGNPGFNIALGGNGTGIDVNIGDGSNRADLLSGTINDGAWHHVLVVFDRDANLSMYIDGDLVEETGLSNVTDINSPYTFKLGQDGTGTYGQAATSDLGYVRIWDRAMAYDDVAGFACSTDIQGSSFEANLLHNWTMTEGMGTTITDVVTTNPQEGTFNGGVTWVEGSFPALVVSFESSANGAVASFVNTSNDATSFAWSFGDGSTSMEANPIYTYTSTGTYDVKLIASNACGVDSFMQQVVIDNITCNAPTDLMVESTGIKAAKISWTRDAFMEWELEYGPQGFAQGTGNTIVTTRNPYVLDNLQAESDYDVYVREICGGLESDWAGPVGFTTNGGLTEEGFGNALLFDGIDDFVDLTAAKANADSIGLPTSELTVSAWVNINSFNDYAGVIGFLQDNGSFERGFLLHTRASGTISFIVATEDSQTLDYGSTQITVPSEEWIHLAATYDGTRVRVYVDGAEQLNYEKGGAISYADSWLVIGKYQDDNEEYLFDGSIDEVGIFDKALTQDEILGLICKKTDALAENTLGYYPMADGSGDVLSDFAGVLNGSISGASWTSSVTGVESCEETTGVESDFNAVAFLATGDYINTDWAPVFGTDQDFAIEFRIKSDAWNSDPSIFSNKDWNSGGNPGFNIALAGSGRGIDVNVGDGSNRSDLEGGEINDGAWHHVLVNFDRDGEVVLYIDGVLIQSRDMSNVGDLNTEFTFKMGQDGTGTYSATATAEISDIRVWNRVLPIEESGANRCDRVDPDGNADLLHYWKLDEGTGTSVADSKGGNNGTFVGATTTWTQFNNFPNALASFSASTTLSTVEFINNSSVGTYSWDFGDGNTSKETNPIYTYTALGTYEVSLIVQNACDADTTIQTLTITDLDNNLLNSLDLNGVDDYVQFNNDLNFGTDQDFTIELFVKSSGWSSDPSIIGNKDWGSGSNPGFVIAAQSNGITWKFNIGDGSNRIDMNGGTINDNQWHHIAVSFDRDGEKLLFHDGAILDRNTNAFNGSIDSDLDLAIGQDGTLNYGAFFKGQVAEVRIWNAALDSLTLTEQLCEVSDEHPNLGDLLHYWKADEGEGTVVADTQGNNDGTYNGEWTASLNTFEGCEAPIPVNELGAGNAIDFDGEDDFVRVDKNDIFEIPNTITLEGWVKARSFNQWESFLNYVQDNGSNESGFDFAYVDSKLRFRVMTTEMAGNEWNGNPGAAIPLNQWVHVAGTYDGNSMKMYVNGELMEEQEKSGPIDWEFKPLELRIGSYIDDNELYYWDGTVDEVRIWDVARTEEEIRSTMCVELDGDEEGLVAYYRLDELAGIEVVDLGPNRLNGEMGNTLVPSQDRIVSGAGIGEESTYVYPESWDATSLTLASADQGELTVKNVMNNPKGVQIYRVDGTPTYIEGIQLLEGDHGYYGVVIAGGIGVSYDIDFDYTNNTNAIAVEESLFLGVRRNGEGRIWTNIVADLDTDQDVITKSGISQRREYILASSSGVSCEFPDGVVLDSASFSTINISWNSPADTSNVEYGPAGFSLGEGTLVEGVPTSLQVAELATAETVDFYLQDICSETEASSWVGPFSFTSEICRTPSGPAGESPIAGEVIFLWESSDNATAYNLQWGPLGTELGNGIAVNDIDSTSYQISSIGLDTIQYYIQSVCGEAGTSDWVGPVSFALTDVETIIPQFANMKVFPNPTNGWLNVTFEALQAQKAQLSIINILGQELYRETLDLKGGNYNVSTEIDMTNFSKGTYFINLIADQQKLTKKVSLQ